MPTSRLPQAMLSAFALTFAAPLTAQAEDAALFTEYAAESTSTVDNSAYIGMIEGLTEVQGGRPLVAYDIANSRALPFFAQYVGYLEGIPVAELNRDEQLAFWLNTRNVVLLRALAEEKRVRGFKRKRGTPSEPGAFWTEKRITVNGTALSLQDIEQDILLAGWDDPNIIFGLYQGLKGGPALPQEPFTGANVQKELALAGKRFTLDRRNFRVRGDTVRISSYFDWYLASAYQNDEAALRTHLASFADDDAKDLVQSSGKLTRKSLSTDFEQFRTRQANVDLGAGRGAGGYGS